MPISVPVFQKPSVYYVDFYFDKKYHVFRQKVILTLLYNYFFNYDNKFLNIAYRPRIAYRPPKSRVYVFPVFAKIAAAREDWKRGFRKFNETIVPIFKEMVW